MKKALRFAVLFLIFPFSLFASFFDITHVYSFEPLIITNRNALLWGGGYEVKAVGDRVLVMAGVKGYYAEVPVIKEDSAYYGLYIDGWKTTDASYEKTSYARVEVPVSLGWNISNFFMRDQFIYLTIAPMAEREEYKGGDGAATPYGWQTGRYYTSLNFMGDVATVWNMNVVLKAGFGGVGYQDKNKADVVQNFVRLGVALEMLPQKQKPAEEPAKEEGEALWEEGK
jgi:hypothetical protein